ncbi:MAG: ABC transporter permease [Actinomycetota bacterium]
MTAQPGGVSLRAAVSSEWSKLWSIRSTYWSLAVTAVLVVGFVLLITLSAAATNANGIEVLPMTPAEVAGGGMFYLGQLGLAALAALNIAGEYASGSILATLQWVPRRGRMLLSKLLVVSSVLFVAGAAITGLGVLAGMRPLEGISAAWDLQQVLADMAKIGLYSAVVGVIALGLGAAIRSIAGTLACTVLLLVVVPQALASTGIDFLITLSDLFPGPAGMALLDGVLGQAGHSMPVALAILLVWCITILGLGSFVLLSRDAT